MAAEGKDAVCLRIRAETQFDGRQGGQVWQDIRSASSFAGVADDGNKLAA